MQVTKNHDAAVPESGIEVLPDSWKQSESGNLYVRNVSSFAVAAIFNEDRGGGYLGNFSGQPLKENEAFKQFLSVLHEWEYKSNLGIWLGGVAILEAPTIHPETLDIYNTQAGQDMMQLADAVLDLREISDEEIHTTWLGVNKEIVIAKLNCATGDFEYKLRQIEPSEFEDLSQ